MNRKGKHYLFTLSAFVIASSLIDELTSTEQNALGNWFMLVGQTLCTNGSSNFNDDFKDVLGRNGSSDDLLRKTKEALEKHLNSKIE